MAKKSRYCSACWPKHHKGENAGNWKGGRFVHADGYAFVYRPDHPRSSKQGYVREHHVVMEEAIGRLLVRGENVHHRNGVKDDNRLENLELWVSSQPSGQRAVDLLEWARGIIATYEPIESKLLPAAEAE